MSQRLSLEERSRDGSATASPVAGDAPPTTEMTHTTVFPTPLHTLAAAAVGILAGLGVVYLVASRLAGTPAAVAVIVMIFAATMAGPLVQSRAGTELGRVIAVALQSIVFGGVLGALILVI